MLFVAERRRLSDIEDPTNIQILGLDVNGRREAVKSSWLIFLRCLSHFGQVCCLRGDILWIFYYYVCGKAATINGCNNVYCTFEHLVTFKAVRNELLRSSGNKSVFVPMNSYVTNQFFHSEFMFNYDVVLSSGRHLEDMYPRKLAKTKIYLPTGSYTSHRMLIPDRDRCARQVALKNFKKHDTLILVTSPGICPPTLNIEIKLMELLRCLSNVDGIKLVLRMKPTEPVPMFRDFYRQQLAGVKNVMITAGEYDLFDFVGVVLVVIVVFAVVAVIVGSFFLSTHTPSVKRIESSFFFHASGIGLSSVSNGLVPN